MSDDQSRTLLSAGALVVSCISLLWSYLSWRNAGSRLRVHALLYRQVLVFWIFNAGRTTDRVERIVLGGRRGGVGGFELTKATDLPITLAPGEAYRKALDWRQIIPEDRHSLISAGWESVWLLLGSMQQKRVELVAEPDDYPPRVGWRLTPRGANVTRYLPLIMYFPMIVVFAGSVHSELVSGDILSLMWVVFLVRATSTRSLEPTRRRVERWVVAGAVALASTSWELKARAAGGGWLARASVVYIIIAIGLAWLGAVQEIRDFVRDARQRLAGRWNRR